MVSRQVVEEQLRRIGCNFRFWGRSEVNELGRILLDDEIIAECVNGEYSNGFALLVATNHRVLLVDKKPMLYLTVEDLRYEMITEFSFSHRMLNATLNIHTTNKALTFSSWNQSRLRRLLEYTQQRVLEMRQQQHMAQQFQAAAAAQYAQLHAANFYQPLLNYAPNLAPPAEQPAAAGAGGQAVVQSPGATPVTSDAPVAQLSAAGDSQPQPTAAAHVAHTPQATAQAVMSRFTAKRAALGTYTRSKLPSFRRHHDYADSRTPAAEADAKTQPQSGEVMPQGYNPAKPSLEYGLPYEY